MKKSYIITFSISVIVMFSVAIIFLMLMLPQNVNIVDSEATKYQQIAKTDYTFNKTKDVSQESLQKEYSITSSQIESFAKKNQYKAGNSDPFTAAGTNTNNGNANNGNTNNGGTTPDEETTNSNGGTPNPPSANK